MFISKFLRISLIFFFITLLMISGFAWAQDYSEIIKTLKMRSIGPAIMGGRVVDFAVVEGNTAVIYAAVGPSGVFKSTNNAVTWDPVFDKENTVAVGAVAVSQSHQTSSGWGPVRGLPATAWVSATACINPRTAAKHGKTWAWKKPSTPPRS